MQGRQGWQSRLGVLGRLGRQCRQVRKIRQGRQGRCRREGVGLVLVGFVVADVVAVVGVSSAVCVCFSLC